MKVIELCGLPGCGKSTITGPVVKSLKDGGTQAASGSDIYFYNTKGRNSAASMLRCLARPRDYRLYWHILKLNRKYSKSLRCVKHALRLMLLISRIEDAQKAGKYELAVMDEGIIQYMSAQADGTIISDDRLCRRIVHEVSQRLPGWYVVYCVSDVDEAMRRIRERGAVSDRFSPKLSDVELGAVLEKRKYDLVLLTSIKCDHKIAMNTGVSECQERLTEIISGICGGADA